MAKVAEWYTQANGAPVVICDFSPPRGADPGLAAQARGLAADFISVAYSPGKAARVNSAIMAYWLRQQAGKEVIFTLATRDMNKVALQGLLLGAYLLGLENVVVVKGDDFSPQELASVKAVNDFKPTGLLKSIQDLNRGTDYKGQRLRAATDFCIGATIDLGRGLERELALTRRKVEAGAQFFITQPIFDPALARQFLDRYAGLYGQPLTAPVFFGVQVLARDGIVFSSVPAWATSDLQKGRPGQDIALQLLHQFTREGLNAIYLVPPILRGGVRDYGAAQAVLGSLRAGR